VVTLYAVPFYLGIDTLVFLDLEYFLLLTKAYTFQIAVGTKSGEILIYDIASSTLIETVKAHTSTVWSMHLRADGQALVTGSADKDVKFWLLEHQHATDESVSVCVTNYAPPRLIQNLGSKWETPDFDSRTHPEDV